jgi:hypothetical protein
MTNMEQPNIAVEPVPSFLQGFALKIEETRKNIEAVPEQREHFMTHGASRRVRKGNFSDFLMMEQQITTRAADHVLGEMQKKMSVATSPDDRRHEKIAAKLVAFYHTQAKLFSEYAEALDDKDLSELALIIEREFPHLKETYEKYMDQFTAP